jgi:hypothetical protein
LHGALVEHLGRANSTYATLILELDIPAFLDLVEVLVEECERPHRYSVPSMNGGRLAYRPQHAAAIPDFRRKFNDLADRHRLGYRLENGEIQRIGSPALSEVVVGPAVLVTQQPGWEQVWSSHFARRSTTSGWQG